MGILSSEMGYEDAASSVFGAVFIIGGIVGSAIMGVYVEVSRKYKQSMIIISAVGMIGPLGLLGSLYTREVWPVCIAVFILGFDLAILPVGIDFGVEATFPIAEPISTGLLMSFSQVFGITFVISCTALISEYGE